MAVIKKPTIKGRKTRIVSVPGMLHIIIMYYYQVYGSNSLGNHRPNSEFPVYFINSYLGNDSNDTRYIHEFFPSFVAQISTIYRFSRSVKCANLLNLSNGMQERIFAKLTVYQRK